MRYIPHTAGDVSQMLEKIGVGSLEDLFVEVPESVRLKRPLDLPEAISETELLREFKSLATKNAALSTHKSFLGGGAYHHFSPAAIDMTMKRYLRLEATTQRSIATSRSHTLRRKAPEHR